MTDLHIDFDLETWESELLFRMGPEFLRVAGYSTGSGVRITTDPHELIDVLKTGASVTGHNILGFDLLVLAKNYGLDIWKLASEDRIRDTMLLAFLDDPPSARMNAGQIDKHYSLDNVAQRLFGAQKYVDASKALARQYEGWGHIPTDDSRFHSYIDQDVALTGRIADYLCDDDRRLDDYAEREHRIAALGAQMTLNGFRVDHDEVLKRVAAGEEKRATIIKRLVEDHGLPTERKDGSASKSPQNTQEGRAAVKRAFEAVGAKYMPKTPKGAWATGKEAMEAMIGYYGSDKSKLSKDQQAAVTELAETVLALNGIRTVFETINNFMGEEDGLWRVHSSVTSRQASGRFSITKPGLTVMGKRGGRHTEREVYLPEPGHVIVSVDLSQIDARAVAVLSQDRNYMKMFGPGRDLHTEVALRVFGTKAMREQTKPLNHGYNYGLGANKVINEMGADPKVVHQFYRQMREQFPRLNAWKDEMADIASSGRLLDNGFGRKMRPDVKRAYTQGPALMGQGCARDLMAEGLLRLPRETHQYLRGIVHDEVLLSVPIDIADDVEKTVIDAMTFEWAPPRQQGAIPIQIIAEANKQGKNWGACYEGK